MIEPLSKILIVAALLLAGGIVYIATRPAWRWPVLAIIVALAVWWPW